jgi:hypothetical protein
MPMWKRDAIPRRYDYQVAAYQRSMRARFAGQQGRER